MELRKARVTNRIVLLLVLCLLLSPGCMINRSKYKYLYPDGYIGWTRINFKKGAAMPPIEDGAYIFKFTSVGELDISTEFKKVGSDYPNLEFYYYADDMQYKLIWPTSAGSVNVQKREDIERENYEESQHYQFVGSDEEYQIHSDRLRDKDGNPRVGLVKKEEFRINESRCKPGWLTTHSRQVQVIADPEIKRVILGRRRCWNPYPKNRLATAFTRAHD